MKKLLFLLLCLPIMACCEVNKYVKFYSPGYTPAYQRQSQMNPGQQQQAVFEGTVKTQASS
jgi:hypothetical protein